MCVAGARGADAQHPCKTNLISTFSCREIICAAAPESRGGSGRIGGGIKSNLPLVTNSILRMLACVLALRCVNPGEGSAECFHSYGKVAADSVFGCSWKRVSSILHSGSVCPSTKEPLEHMRMGGSVFFSSFYSSFEVSIYNTARVVPCPPPAL